jgi:protein-S-isoprenylcysteine O-methyltransferase Ste14
MQQINPIAIGKGKNGFRKVVEICLMMGRALWVVVVLSVALHFEEKLFLPLANKPVLEWQFVKLIGAALLVCSLIMYILALISFGNSWRIGIDEKSPGNLVSRGIFGVTRNPIFLSLIVYASGAFLLSGRLILLVFAVLIAAGVQYQIVQEEKFLLSRYGKAYEDYCARTGRYISFRRSSRAKNEML